VNNDTHGPAVERLFPFVLRSRILVVGRDALRRRRGKLHFVLITADVSANSREEILRDFAHYPVVQHYQAADLERLFKIRGAKVIGFAKSGLAQSVYAELKSYRINQPQVSSKPPESPPAPPTARKAAPRSPSRKRDPK
jgi:hypothetical protein